MQRTPHSFMKNRKERKKAAFFLKEQMPNPGRYRLLWTKIQPRNWLVNHINSLSKIIHDSITVHNFSGVSKPDIYSIVFFGETSVFIFLFEFSILSLYKTYFSQNECIRYISKSFTGKDFVNIPALHKWQCFAFLEIKLKGQSNNLWAIHFIYPLI